MRTGVLVKLYGFTIYDVYYDTRVDFLETKHDCLSFSMSLPRT